jgi:hypothetical protein
MARARSFLITVSNNKTEKEGIDYLGANAAGFFYVDRVTRLHILNLLDQPPSFSRAFDMIYIPRFDGQAVTENVIETNINEVILIELKTTKKYLPENPKGFFFGATENEFRFAKSVGAKFRFCFVCLHPHSLSYAMLSMDELLAAIKTKHIQYQINL